MIDYTRKPGEPPSDVAPAPSRPAASSATGVDYRRSRFAQGGAAGEATHSHWLDEPLAAQYREVDGIPTYWVPRTGLTTATITFRVGRADEPLARAGLSHLVEHLALFKLGRQPHYFNGGVEAYLTSFTMRGTPGEVVAFFNGLAAALQNLPMHRLADEKNIVATEATSRGLSAFDFIREIRYGATGIASLNYREFGLHTVEPEHLEDWRQRYFHRNNATIAISGPFPNALSFAIPEGREQPIRQQVPLHRRFPAQSLGSDTLVILGLSSPPSLGLKFAAAIGAQRGMHQLRYDRALSYTVGMGNEPEGSSNGELVGYADVLPGKAHLVTNGLLALFEDLVERPPSFREMNEYREGIATTYFDADFAGELVTRASRQHLLGKPVLSWEAHEARLAAVRPEDVADLVRKGMDTAVMVIPEHVGKDLSRFSDAEAWSPDVVRGEQLAFSAEAREDLPDLSVVLADDGVSVIGPKHSSTVIFRRCCVALQSIDGAITLIAEDGQQVRIHPGMLTDAAYDRLSDRLEAAIPESCRVRAH